MAGFETIKVIRDFEQACYELGFEITKSNFGGTHTVALRPADDNFPHYSRDAELFNGTVEEAILWLRGLKWSREYDEMIKLSTEQRRTTQEQKERNRQLMQSIKTGKKVSGSLDVWEGESFDREYTEEEDPPF